MDRRPRGGQVPIHQLGESVPCDPTRRPPRTCASKTLPTTSQANHVASKLKRFGIQQAETDFVYWVFEQVPQSA